MRKFLNMVELAKQTAANKITKQNAAVLVDSAIKLVFPASSVDIYMHTPRASSCNSCTDSAILAELDVFMTLRPCAIDYFEPSAQPHMLLSVLLNADKINKSALKALADQTRAAMSPKNALGEPNGEQFRFALNIKNVVNVKMTENYDRILCVPNRSKAFRFAVIKVKTEIGILTYELWA